MGMFLCKLWPYLFGGLIGWLLSGLLARRFKFQEKPTQLVVEKIVEKNVDNPVHLQRISSLEKELGEVRGAVVASDNTSLLADKDREIGDLKSRLATIEKELAKARSGAAGNVGAGLVGGAAAVAAAGVKDNKAEVEKKDQEIGDLKSRLAALEKDLAGHQGDAQKLRQEADNLKQETTKYRDEADKLKQESAKYRDEAEGLQRKLDTIQRDYIPVPQIDLAAAKAAGLEISSATDFTVIEGIGPKINELIHAEGINTFLELSRTDVAVLQNILDKAGPAYKLAVPTTWAQQAEYVVYNRWQSLKKWQDELDHGQ